MYCKLEPPKNQYITSCDLSASFPLRGISIFWSSPIRSASPHKFSVKIRFPLHQRGETCRRRLRLRVRSPAQERHKQGGANPGQYEFFPSFITKNAFGTLYEYKQNARERALSRPFDSPIQLLPPPPPFSLSVACSRLQPDVWIVSVRQV